MSDSVLPNRRNVLTLGAGVGLAAAVLFGAMPCRGARGPPLPKLPSR